MPKLCRINIDDCERIFEEIKDLAKTLKEKLPVEEVYLFGSFAENKIHEGSDIDLIIVGDFEERFPYRIGKVLELTNLPIEPFVYTKEEFEKMKRDRNPFIIEALRTAKKL